MVTPLGGSFNFKPIDFSKKPESGNPTDSSTQSGYTVDQSKKGDTFQSSKALDIWGQDSDAGAAPSEGNSNGASQAPMNQGKSESTGDSSPAPAPSPDGNPPKYSDAAPYGPGNPGYVAGAPAPSTDAEVINREGFLQRLDTADKQNTEPADGRISVGDLDAASKDSEYTNEEKKAIDAIKNSNVLKKDGGTSASIEEVKQLFPVDPNADAFPPN